jgi:uncharacterized membrane protein (DUF373 family)
MIETLKKYKFFIEIFLAITLFLFIVNGAFSFLTILSYLLMFIVLIEVIRMVTTYVLGSEPVMKLRFIIDGFIVFFLRDLVLIFSDPKYNLNDKEDKLIVVSALIFVLFIFRAMSLIFSPNDKNCKSCISKKYCDIRTDNK